MMSSPSSGNIPDSPFLSQFFGRFWDGRGLTAPPVACIPKGGSTKREFTQHPQPVKENPGEENIPNSPFFRDASHWEWHGSKPRDSRKSFPPSQAPL